MGPTPLPDHGSEVGSLEVLDDDKVHDVKTLRVVVEFLRPVHGPHVLRERDKHECAVKNGRVLDRSEIYGHLSLRQFPGVHRDRLCLHCGPP